MARVRREEAAAIDSAILRTLSMNGRATLDFIGAQAGGLSKHPTYRRIKVLEERYGIKYLAEIDFTRFGYLSYMAFVKFRGGVPSMEELRAALEKEPRIQMVSLTNGAYDMVICFLSEDPRAAAYMVFQLKTTTILAKYSSNWYVTSYYSKDFIPIRDDFFELLRQRVWQRGRNRKRPAENDLLEREFLVLRELNRDGSTSFTDLDRRLGLESGASRYTYYKLKEKGMLKRITISLTGLPIKYNAILMTNSYHGEEFARTRANLLAEILKDGAVVDKYALVTDIGVPAGSLMVMPVFEYGELKETEDSIMSAVKGIEISTLIITGTVFGSFVYRKYDKAYSNQYKLLVEEYQAAKHLERIDYDETSRPRRRSRRSVKIDLKDLENRDE